MKKILIAHQSTIPHYRVAFYNALQQYKSEEWCFDVVFDPRELKNKRFFKEEIDPKQFKFSTLEVNTFTGKIWQTKVCYQTFWQRAARYDLIVIEQIFHNLTYPLCHFYQLKGTKIMHWGHGRHIRITNPTIWKTWLEEIKMVLTRQADGFFSYTPGVKSFLIEQNIPADRIFILNNTIDINQQRRAFQKFKTQKETIKQSLRIPNKKVLLFVGRFEDAKRIKFLLKAFRILIQRDRNFHLLLVGSGGATYLSDQPENITYFGSVVNLEQLAPIYVAADILSFPGALGLAPLQAFCYDLPVVTIDSPLHAPEFEYLSPQNSLILPANTTPQDYAEAILQLFANPQQLSTLQASTWQTIAHLTIEQMAKNFATGIETVLDL